MDKIQGKVAKILNSRELVINRGSNDGVIRGMVFDVLDPTEHEIRDPDSGDVLGAVKRPKIRVRVVDVQDRMAIARTFLTRSVNVGGMGVSGMRWVDAFSPPKLEEKPETLRTNEATWEQLSEQDSQVKTGDPVIQVLPEKDP